MSRHALQALVFFALTASVDLAHAEGAALCASGRIVEVFSGTAECPGADYVIVELAVGFGSTIPPIATFDRCGAFKDYFGDNPGSWNGAATRVLVARPDAERLFGIAADMVASAGVPAPDGWLSYQCNSDQRVVYGAYPDATAPALVPGKALKWTGNSWVLGDPGPVNSSGDVGVLGTCPPDAGGEPASAGGAPSCLDAGATPPDASPGDSGSPRDSGAPSASPTGAGTGCACREAPARESGPWSVAPALVALALRRRRR